MLSFRQLVFRGFLISALFTCTSASKAAGKMQIIGQVVESEKTSDKPIGFATVILMDSLGKTHAGTASDVNGNFTLEGDWKGKLKLICSYVGYEKLEQVVNLDPKKLKLDVGKLYLKSQATELKEVVVSARAITREADRFVVRLEGSDKAVGRTALEVVSESPGVWVGNDQLSVNGKSGTVVMVNNRVLNMTFDELKLYLSNLKAEEIQRIEIIPNGGAEYDANARGGIIKITLRRQRLDGIEGSVGTDFNYADHQRWDVRPNLNLNIKSGDFQVYGSGMVNDSHGRFENWQSTDYKYSSLSSLPASSTGSESKGKVLSKSNMGNFRLGAVYDINKMQSFGLEYSEFSRFRDKDLNVSTSSMRTQTSNTENSSVYRSDGSFARRSLTSNYILKLDTLGSELKLVGDFMWHKNSSTDLYNNSSSIFPNTDPMNPLETDSSYRTASNPDYKVYTLAADLNYVLKGGHKITGGLKFYNNRMLSGQLFEEMKSPDVWEKNDIHSFDNIYSERITAAYVKFSSKWKFLTYSAGLRAEHTYAHPKTTQVLNGVETVSENTQDYINWFPNFNVSSPLNANGSNMLIFNYDRKISRPSFWQINPFRMQLSEYSYISGNPDLNPNITQDLSFTFVYKYRYTLTVGATFEQDEIQQSGSVDVEKPDVFVIRFENINQTHSYYAAATAPLNPTKWWSMNLNLTGIYQKISYKGETHTNPAGFANLTNSFTLPKGFVIDVNGNASSKLIAGNMEIRPMYNLDLGVKRSFFDKKLSASVRLDDIVLGGNDIRIKMLDKTVSSIALSNPQLPIETLNYTRARGNFPTIRLSLRYNFSLGTKFKVKNVEGTNDDVTKRINQNN